ncbi:hypothetical protein V5H98_15795 [Georgenia sp. M64]|uniref:hypothetical protein n=1 Tax=Georgenia sp. M64 TaxID=3120520 RepID=UPI0030E096D6
MIDVEIGLTPKGRRAFPLEFRIEFLAQWDACVEYGAKMRLLREHALARKTVSRWLHARESGQWQAAMESATQGSSSRVDSQDRAELARLRIENEALKSKVARSEAAQEILGKAFELLQGINTGSTEPATQIPPSLMSADEYAQWLKRHRLS